MIKMIIVGCSASQGLGKKIARKLHKKYYDLKVGSFPDGETHLKFSNKVRNRTVVLVQTLHNPNEKLIEILLAGYTAKDLGARKIILVAPYLAYMRQDKRFHAGEAVSNRIIAKLFKVFDEIITVDPHLHRIKSLREIFRMPAYSLTANYLLSEYIRKNIRNAVVVGPDAESYQWALGVARSAGCEAIVLKKKRYSSKNVRIKLHDPGIVRSRNVVIVDDIISTGHTMMETVKQVKQAGAKKIYCLCVHGVFAGNALAKLRKLGAAVVSTNTIENPVSLIDCSPLVVKAFTDYNKRK
ncbi:ribose-phosphate diphosphokinase [Candidatus Woesearchaeota archaeon]|nr:ribose-phosphate diphosphokinase [Candidatus Woesearchaeota archaeon]